MQLRNLGFVLIKTAAQGDCGIDVMCQMLAVEQENYVRASIRTRPKDYLTQHAAEPWMWEMMSACQEFDHEEVSYCMLALQERLDCTALAAL